MAEKKSKLTWFINRLRTMDTAEVTYRVKGALQKQYEKRFKMGYAPHVQLKSFPEKILFTEDLKGDFNTKTYSIFGRPLNLEKEIDWHYDLISDKRFPDQPFSYSINTRTEENGIVKVVWEVNRLQFLTSICLAYQKTKDEALLSRFIEIIESWNKSNPYLKGVNWYSNIEINLRVITWLLCWEILDANNLYQQNEQFKEFTDSTWIPLIYLHGHFAHSHPSKFSSSNNHLIAEAAGLFLAGAYWDFNSSDSKKWAKEGQEILEREIVKQHTENGINREEASEYIQFITDFFLIAYVVGQRTGYPFSKKYETTLAKILEYVYQLMDVKGNVPYYGDDDDGHTFVIEDENQHSSNFRSLLVTGTLLFGNEKLKAKSGAFDLKNQVLFGVEGKSKFEAVKPEFSCESVLYKEEGHFLIKQGNGIDKEVYLHVDVAPLGYLSIAAHGHADALSFYLHVDGNPIFIDIGTYTYHSEPEWRAYFKGTLGHNTIRVDQQDQAKDAGPCLWVNHFQSELEQCAEDADSIIVRGRHNAYDKLGVRHQRTYRFDKNTEQIRIEDELTVQDETGHLFEMPFHLHPELNVTQLSDNQFKIMPESGRGVLLTLDPQLKPSLVNGSLDPILGWYSPSFLQKGPTNVIYSKLTDAATTTLITEIEILT